MDVRRIGIELSAQWLCRYSALASTELLLAFLSHISSWLDCLLCFFSLHCWLSCRLVYLLGHHEHATWWKHLARAERSPFKATRSSTTQSRCAFRLLFPSRLVLSFSHGADRVLLWKARSPFSIFSNLTIPGFAITLIHYIAMDTLPTPMRLQGATTLFTYVKKQWAKVTDIQNHVPSRFP